MAEIAEDGKSHENSGKKRAKKQSTKIDMTPMVDLAFLLLTFFVLTASFSKQKALELSLPAEGEPSPLKKGMTLLLTGDNRIFYYSGEFHAKDNTAGKTPTQLKETTYSKDGLHKLLLEENEWTVKELKNLEARAGKKEISKDSLKKIAIEKMGNKESLTVLVKTDKEATYKNVIDVLDELKLCNVGKQVAGLEMSSQEYDLLNQKIK